MSLHTVDVEQRVQLGTITEAQVSAAVATITRHATDEADRALLMDMVRPRVHAPDAGPARRRATPKRATA
jgi:hypothetical protein